MTMTAISEEGVDHAVRQHCRDCPQCDHAYDDASIEDAAAAWLVKMPCPCATIDVLLCAGCGEGICYLADSARGLCEHYGRYAPASTPAPRPGAREWLMPPPAPPPRPGDPARCPGAPAGPVGSRHGPPRRCPDHDDERVLAIAASALG